MCPHGISLGNRITLQRYKATLSFIYAAAAKCFRLIRSSEAIDSTLKHGKGIYLFWATEKTQHMQTALYHAHGSMQVSTTSNLSKKTPSVTQV
jgi:hypothetical protein